MSLYRVIIALLCLVFCLSCSQEDSVRHVSEINVSDNGSTPGTDPENGGNPTPTPSVGNPSPTPGIDDPGTSPTPTPVGGNPGTSPTPTPTSGNPGTNPTPTPGGNNPGTNPTPTPIPTPKGNGHGSGSSDVPESPDENSSGSSHDGCDKSPISPPTSADLAACEAQVGVSAKSFKIARAHEKLNLKLGESFIIKLTGVHEYLDLLISSNDGSEIGAGCIILGTGNKGGNGNHAVMKATITAKIGTLFIMERGNHARALIDFQDGAEVKSFKADLSGNHVSFKVTGKAICPSVLAWGNHTSYACGN